MEDNIRENLGDLRFGGEFLGTTPKAHSMKEITDKLVFIKIKTSTVWKSLLREWQDKPQTEKEHLQVTQTIKDYYPNYTKNS